MKNLNLRTILFAFLVIASLSSYVYINTVSVEKVNKCAGVDHVHEQEENEQEASKIFVPDIQFVKKLLGKTKTFLPAL